MKRISLIIAAGLLSLGLTTAHAQEDEGAASMAELLRLIEQGQARDSQEARQREAAFAQARNRQQALLNQARAERTTAGERFRHASKRLSKPTSSASSRRARHSMSVSVP